MLQCPICNADYPENVQVTCSTCEWDLTCYPATLKGLIQERESRANWARQLWKSRHVCTEEVENPGDKCRESRLGYTYADSTLTVYFPDEVDLANNKPLAVISCQKNELKILMDEYAKQFEWLTKDQRQNYLNSLEKLEFNLISL